ncbi:RIKEN cDNA A130023I24, partial [Mus musculus]
ANSEGSKDPETLPALHWHCKWQGHGKGSCYICTWWRCLFISRSQTGMLEEEQLANRTSECLVLSCLSVCLSVCLSMCLSLCVSICLSEARYCLFEAL